MDTSDHLSGEHSENCEGAYREGNEDDNEIIPWDSRKSVHGVKIRSEQIPTSAPGECLGV